MEHSSVQLIELTMAPTTTKKRGPGRPPKKEPETQEKSGKSAHGDLGFKESAIEVLKRHGKPLKAQRIVELAVEQGDYFYSF